MSSDPRVPPPRVPPPWSADDVLYAAEALGWPAVALGDSRIDGDAAWREALDGGDGGADPDELRKALLALPDDEELGGDEGGEEREHPGLYAPAKPVGDLWRRALPAVTAAAHARPPGTTRAMTAQPTEAQWRAVRESLERFLGRGRWSALMPVSAALPNISFRWAEDLGSEGDRQRLATTTIHSPSNVTITLRIDRTPDELVPTVCHELQHAADAMLLVGILPRAVLEGRAERTAERLRLLR